MHLTWENEALLEVSDSAGALEIVYPPTSIRAEPCVAWVDANVERRGTRALAQAYLEFLFTEDGQELLAQQGYRPYREDVLKKHADRLPPLDLFPVTLVARDWDDAQQKFFSEGGVFDTLHAPRTARRARDGHSMTQADYAAERLASVPPISRLVPAGYGARGMRKDLVAGVTVAAISLPQAMAYALIAGVDPRFGLYSAIVVTAIASLFGSSSHLINGVGFSIVLFIPRAARLTAVELVVDADRVIRRSLPGDARCSAVAIYDVEGELFFGAAPEFDRLLDGFKAAAERGLRVLVLRLRRTRNPDLVCMERLEHFLRAMDRAKVPVFLSGVRPDLKRAMDNLDFQDWLPAYRTFLSDPTAPGSSSVKAVRRAYEIAGARHGCSCCSCPQCTRIDGSAAELYYMV